MLKYFVSLFIILTTPVSAGPHMFQTVEGAALYLKRSNFETHRAEFTTAQDCEHIAKIMSKAEPLVRWYCATSTLPDDLSYVDGSKPFIQIKDINRQAEAWGTCSAAYEVMSMLLKSTPAQAKQIKNYSNGATIAVTMTHVSSSLTPDMTPEKFNSIWNYSKTLGDSIPEVKRTMILASAESLGKSGANKFADKITATVKVCDSNLADQEMYLDAWRNLAKSGLLKTPKQ